MVNVSNVTHKIMNHILEDDDASILMDAIGKVLKTGNTEIVKLSSDSPFNNIKPNVFPNYITLYHENGNVTIYRNFGMDISNIQNEIESVANDVKACSTVFYDIELEDSVKDYVEFNRLKSKRYEEDIDGKKVVWNTVYKYEFVKYVTEELDNSYLEYLEDGQIRDIKNMITDNLLNSVPFNIIETVVDYYVKKSIELKRGDENE